MKPTSTRTMLIDTSARISPLISIGIAVRITSTGGGIRNGLNMKVDSNCQMKKAISSEVADSSIPRYRPWPTESRSARNDILGAGRAEGAAGLSSRTFTIGPLSPSGCRSLRCHELFRPDDVGLQQCLDLVKQLRDLGMGEIAWAWKVDLDDLGDGGTRPDRHHRDPVGQQDGLGNVMGDEDHRLAGALPDCEQDRMHPATGEGVERTERLVHHQDFPLDREGPPDLQAPAPAPGEVRGEFGLSSVRIDPVPGGPGCWAPFHP